MLLRGEFTDELLDVIELVQNNVSKSWLNFYDQAPVTRLAMALDGYEVALSYLLFLEVLAIQMNAYGDLFLG